MQGNQRLTALAVATLWLLNGLVTGSLSAKLPELAKSLDLSDGQLGLALLGQTVGLVVIMFTVADRLVLRFGARLVAVVAAFLYSASFVAPAQAGGLSALFASLLVIGAFNAPLDVTMIELGGELEQRWQRRLMSRFEFAFNGGLVVAAGLAFAAADRIDLESYLVLVAAVGVVLTLAATPFLPGRIAASSGEAETEAQDPRGPAISIWAMAALALAALWCEATVLDWMGIYYDRTFDAGPAEYAIGLLCFVAGLMLSLWGGNRLADRFGPGRVVGFGAAAFAAGLATTLVSPSLLLADAGLAIAGLGMANIHPLAVSAAQRGGGPTAVARVGGTSYVGLALAKPVIGGVAEVSSLQLALAISVLVALAMIAGARAFGDGSHPGPPAEPERPDIDGDRRIAAVLEYGNRGDVVVIVVDVSAQRHDLAASLVPAISRLARREVVVERVLLAMADRVNPHPPSGVIGIDAELLSRVRAAAAGVDGVAEVGEPIVDAPEGEGVRAVIAVAPAPGATDALFEACASAVADAVPELHRVLVCREARL